MAAFDDCCDDCCSGWKDLWWCVLCLAVLAAVAAIVILVAAFGFVRHVDVAVDDASLTRLALVGGGGTPTALAYNLSLTLTIRNPNWAMAMTNAEPLEAAYSFDGQQFDRVRLADEGDAHPAGKTRVYRLTTGSGGGGAPMSLGAAGVAEFRKENAKGVFEVEVTVKGEVKYTARVSKCAVEATCPLKLQLAPPGQAPAALVFQKVRCKVAKADKSC